MVQPITGVNNAMNMLLIFLKSFDKIFTLKTLLSNQGIEITSLLRQWISEQMNGMSITKLGGRGSAFSNYTFWNFDFLSRLPVYPENRCCNAPLTEENVLKMSSFGKKWFKLHLHDHGL